MAPSAEYCLYVIQTFVDGAWHIVTIDDIPATCLTHKEATEAAQALAANGAQVRVHKYLASGYPPTEIKGS